MQYIFGEKMVMVKEKPENTTLIDAEKFEVLKNDITENLAGITTKEYVYVGICFKLYILIKIFHI